MIESTSDNQLLGLIAMFVVLGLMFGVLIVYAMGGFKRSGKKELKKKKWETFKADLTGGSVDGEPQAAEPAFDWGSPMQTGQPPGEGSKPGGLLKTADPPADFTAQTSDPNPIAAAPLDLDARLNGLNGAYTPMSESGAYRELFKVLVDPATKQIIVEVDGEQYETIKQVKKRDIGQRILETVALLLKFTGGMIATTAGMKSLPVPSAGLTALPPASAVPSAKKQPSVPPAATPEPWSQPPPQPTAPPAKVDWFTQPAVPPADLSSKPEPSGGGFSILPKRNKAEDIPLISFNLAEEIDKVLQQKLVVSGERTPVKLETGPGGGLRIRVGINQVFDAVDEVEPANIRNLIQMSIKEWESR
jgi:hypothetical protein